MMSEALITVFSAIFIAGVTSVITVSLSLHRFRREKWWERKADAYVNIIEALHDSKQFADEHLEEEIGTKNISKQKSDELRDKSVAGHNKILRELSIGSFLLSEKAITRIKLYVKEYNEASKHRDWYEYLAADWDAADTCLKDIIVIAKHDLKLSGLFKFLTGPLFAWWSSKEGVTK